MLPTLPLVLAAVGAAPASAAPASSALTEATFPVEFRHVAREAKAVALVGDLNDWNPEATPMLRGEDGVWRVTVRLAAGQWLYKFHQDGKWIPDEKNPLSSPDGRGSVHSWVIVGDGDFRRHEGIPHGRIERVSIPSAALGADVEVNLYLPPAAQKHPPLLVLLHGKGVDRLQWTDNGLVADFMDNLLHRGRIKPFLVAMPSVMPWAEQPKLLDFLGAELPAWLATNRGVRKGKAARALGGFSMGGGITLRLAAERAGTYGLWLPLAAFVPDEELAGWHDLGRAGSVVQYCGREDSGLIELNRRIATTLKEKGARSQYVEVPGAHSFRFLNSVTPDLLERTSRFFEAR